jgi:hypothetical protein
MQLPCAWFEQIVKTLNAPARPTGRGDSSNAGGTGSGSVDGALTGDIAGGQRRRVPRVGVRAPVTLIPLTNDGGLGAAPVAVSVRDLSAGGIGFLHSARVGLDAQFVALLPHGEDSVAVLCEVAYYQQLGKRLFSVGAKFVRVLRQPAGDTSGPTPAALPPAVGQNALLRRVAS